MRKSLYIIPILFCIIQCTGCNKADVNNIESFNNVFNSGYARSVGAEPSEDVYMSYAVDNYGLDADWTPAADDPYPQWNYTHCRENYVMESDIDADGNAEAVLYGGDGGGSESWSYLAFYDEVRGGWIHLMPGNVQENNYNIRVSDEQKEWIVQNLKEKKLSDEKRAQYESGLMYMYPELPAVLEDGSVLVTFYGRNNHELYEEEYVVVKAVLQYRWSEAVGGFELVNYALVIDNDTDVVCSDSDFLGKLPVTAKQEEK